MLLTPNHLLLGRASLDVPDIDYDSSNKFSARLSYVQQVFEAWWQRWIQDVLPTLVPCKRWKEIRRNLKIHNLVMMKYDGNLRDDYRLARVVETFPDSKGLVRNVRVIYRKRDRREPAEAYWRKALSEKIVPIHRLALLQASNEPMPTGDLLDEMPLNVKSRVACVKATLTSSSY